MWRCCFCDSVADCASAVALQGALFPDGPHWLPQHLLFVMFAFLTSLKKSVLGRCEKDETSARLCTRANPKENPETNCSLFFWRSLNIVDWTEFKICFLIMQICSLRKSCITQFIFMVYSKKENAIIIFNLRQPFSDEGSAFCQRFQRIWVFCSRTM